jgi:hypothetical protein
MRRMRREQHVVTEDAVRIPKRRVVVEVDAVGVEESSVQVEPAPLLDITGERKPVALVAA